MLYSLHKLADLSVHMSFMFNSKVKQSKDQSQIDIMKCLRSILIAKFYLV